MSLAINEVQTLGLGQTDFIPPTSPASEQLVDNFQPWLLQDVKGSNTFTENITLEFERFVEGLVGKNK